MNEKEKEIKQDDPLAQILEKQNIYNQEILEVCEEQEKKISALAKMVTFQGIAIIVLAIGLIITNFR